MPAGKQQAHEVVVRCESSCRKPKNHGYLFRSSRRLGDEELSQTLSTSYEPLPRRSRRKYCSASGAKTKRFHAFHSALVRGVTSSPPKEALPGPGVLWRSLGGWEPLRVALTACGVPAIRAGEEVPLGCPPPPLPLSRAREEDESPEVSTP
jgi:hypothetical protein